VIIFKPWDDGKVAQLGQTRHRAVFVHDLANDAGGIHAGDARDVHGRFSLPRTNQHAALLRAQRKDVAGRARSCGLVR